MESKEELIARLLVDVERGVKAEVSYSEALEFRREQYDLTVKEFSFILGVERSHYNEIINGKRSITLSLCRAAAAVGVPMEILLSKNTTQD